MTSGFSGSLAPDRNRLSQLPQAKYSPIMAVEHVPEKPLRRVTAEAAAGEPKGRLQT